LREAGAVSVEVYGDSELVIKQLNGQYECKSEALRSYYEECREILKSFPLVTLQHIPREHNEEANRLAQSASGYKESQKAFAAEACALGTDLAEDDWRKEIVDYLKDPSRKVSRKLRYKAIKFVLLDDNLFYKSLDGGIATMPGSRRGQENDERSTRWDMWSTPVSLPHEMGHQTSRMLLADDIRGLLWVLQGMSRLPEVWKYSKGPRVGVKSHHQAMAIQGLGDRPDWTN
jgi:hypothetical protein